MINYNNMNINIKKGMYQRSKLQEDSKTYLIEDKENIMYELEIHKNYYIDNKEEVLLEISNNLIELGKKIREKVKEDEKCK